VQDSAAEIGSAGPPIWLHLNKNPAHLEATLTTMAVSLYEGVVADGLKDNMRNLHIRNVA